MKKASGVSTRMEEDEEVDHVGSGGCLGHRNAQTYDGISLRTSPPRQNSVYPSKQSSDPAVPICPQLSYRTPSD